MIAASSRPLIEASARNENSSSCVNSSGNALNGPMPMPATAMGNAASAATTSVAPWAPNRRPAQPTIGKNTNVIGTSRVASTPQSPNISCEAPNSDRNTASSSPTRGHVHSTRRPYHQLKISGAVTRTPNQSRSHQSMKSYTTVSSVREPAAISSVTETAAAVNDPIGPASSDNSTGSF